MISLIMHRPSLALYLISVCLALVISACLPSSGSSDLSGFRRIDPGGDYHYRQPSLSPDGAMVVYTRYEPLGPDDKTNTGDIFVTNIKTRETIRITANDVLDSEPAWKPDGQEIVYSRQEAFFDQQSGVRVITESIHTLNLKDRAEATLYICPAACGTPTWSPNGRQVAFSAGAWARQGSTDIPPSDIYLINTDGSGLTRVTPIGSYALGPRWSSDGITIAYKDYQDDCIKTIDLNTSVEKTFSTNSSLKSVSHRLAWYPDKGGIVFSALNPENGRRQIYILQLLDGTIKPFFAQGGDMPLDAQDPDILFDGSQLVFVEYSAIYVSEQTTPTP